MTDVRSTGVPAAARERHGGALRWLTSTLSPLRTPATGVREGSGRPTGPRIKRPGPRGWTGRGAGESVLVEPAPEWRGTTVQVCGLWPFGVGAGTPVVGVPLGRHIFTGATVCCDPISWFQRARLIRNPSMFVLGLPGLGKSTLVRRVLIGLSGYGNIPLVLGDVRPDYVDLIEALGGDVISLGGARGYLNPLDNAEAIDAAGRMEQAAVDLEQAGPARDAGEEAARRQRIGKLLKGRDELLADARARRAALVSALITIQRNGLVLEREDNIIAAALDVLDERFDALAGEVPVLADLLAVVQQAPEAVRAVAVDRDDLNRYKVITEELEASLIGLVKGGRLGQTFSRPTSRPMRRDRPVVFDLSGIQDTQPALRAGALMACWSVGFGTVNVAQALADAGLEPQRHYIIAMDEIHQALRSGPGMVERYDQLTRLNRKYGVGQMMITHTMHDLYALPTVEDREKARGLVERSGMQVLGGLPGAEMPLLTQVVPLSQAEQNLLNKWQEPPSWDPETGSEATPPGLGNFLIKVGARPGIPFQVHLTEAERPVHDTNRLWRAESRISRVVTARSTEHQEATS